MCHYWESERLEAFEVEPAEDEDEAVDPMDADSTLADDAEPDEDRPLVPPADD